jgi:hypothetical protein
MSLYGEATSYQDWNGDKGQRTNSKIVKFKMKIVASLVRSQAIPLGEAPARKPAVQFCKILEKACRVQRGHLHRPYIAPYLSRSISRKIDTMATANLWHRSPSAWVVFT